MCIRDRLATAPICRRKRPAAWRRRNNLFRRLLLASLGVDLIERRYHRIESEHGRGVARLVVAHRLEHRDVGPFAGGRRAVLFEHCLLYTSDAADDLTRV